MQHQLFDDPSPSQKNVDASETLDIFGSDIRLIRRWIPEKQAQEYFESIERSTGWHQPKIRVAGRRIPIPRLQAWYGTNAFSYKYSGTTFQAETVSGVLDEIRRKINEDFSSALNSVLVNLYRDQNDSMGWHADDEPELGPQPMIASVSLGATRRFGLKAKVKPKSEKRQRAHYLELHAGDLLVMQGGTQSFCLHNVPKETQPRSPRINLTYRQILEK